ncbi:histidyl-tRNA synthetase [Stella humosa]|uniref:Histidine--tRNA ligase n=1 Tax=Stella humosa TaxID=94 RepID=A0A3N1M8Q3_9PROT|nr:histidine--tRNA ligase [Stella humosa]ROQ00058.1 histidyl-tRNA synthetase [Stella humosa]BBK30709.1 histidine--tRNA ligase [Stella humosa]
MKSLQPVRGTHDLLPDAFRRHRHVAGRAKAIAETYGFQELATPIFEFAEVFKRTLGDTSDVVSKEMYSFTDRGGEEITLRPEGTAGVCRAVISNGLRQSLPGKFFYDGPMFRYERPQKGRQRQFHQIGIELLGVEGPLADIEAIALGAHILKDLGILEKTTLELNTLGDQESRAAYRAVLVDYFTAHLADLSEDSRARLDRNPLRILDSKDEGDRRLVVGAPSFQEYLTPAARAFFATVTTGLDAIGIAFKLNPRLVRGLDYYCHSAFEFTTTELGAQGTVLGGGRYDGLIEMMGGPATPGVGWAAGIERLAMMVADVAPSVRPIAIVPLGEAAELAALKLTQELRHAGLAVDLGYSGNLGRRLKRADRMGARVAVILGDDELARGAAMVRDLDTGDQAEVELSALQDRLAQFR